MEDIMGNFILDIRYSLDEGNDEFRQLGYFSNIYKAIEALCKLAQTDLSPCKECCLYNNCHRPEKNFSTCEYYD
jgi:hypothetical protein